MVIYGTLPSDLCSAGRRVSSDDHGRRSGWAAAARDRASDFAARQARARLRDWHWSPAAADRRTGHAAGWSGSVSRHVAAESGTAAAARWAMGGGSGRYATLAVSLGLGRCRDRRVGDWAYAQLVRRRL